MKKFKIYKISLEDGQIFYWVRVEIHNVDSESDFQTQARVFDTLRSDIIKSR